MRRFVDEISVKDFNLAMDIATLLESKECGENYQVEFYPDREADLDPLARERGRIPSNRLKVFIVREETKN